jgi:hypothetical protein
MRRSSRSTLTVLLALAAVGVPAMPLAAQSPAASPVASPSAGEAAAPSDAPAVADARLADAVAATVAADTVRTAYSVVFQGSSAIPDGTSIFGSGQTTMGLERRMRLNVDMSQLDSGVIDLIIDGTMLYAKGLPFPGIDADTWLMADLTSDNPLAVQLRALASGNNDASLLLYYLLGATGPAEEVGTEDVDGVTTSHLRTPVDLDRALALVPDEMRETLAANITEMQGGGIDPTLAADVWIDDAGLVHRVAFGYTLGEAMGGGTMDVTFDFREHGVPLDLDVPGPDEVVDIETLG